MQETVYLYLLSPCEHVCFRKKRLVLNEVIQLKGGQYGGGDPAGSFKCYGLLLRCILRNVRRIVYDHTAKRN